MKQAVKKVARTARKTHLAVIASRFNDEICEGLIKGVKGVLEASAGVTYDLHRVPGAFELPLAAQKCARSGKYSGLICLGAVIRGDTPHFDYVCQAATEGISRVALDEGVPVSFGVLTVDNIDQARTRSRPDEYNKGREAAVTALAMFDLLKLI